MSRRRRFLPAATALIVISLFLLQLFEPRWLNTILGNNYEKAVIRNYLNSLEKLSENLSEFKFKNKEWRKYMPETDRLLSQIEEGTVKIPKDIQFTTSAVHTELIVFKKIGFEVGDTFEGFIQARDYLGRNKVHGGDYFRVRFVLKVLKTSVSQSTKQFACPQSSGTFISAVVYLTLQKVCGMQHF